MMAALNLEHAIVVAGHICLDVTPGFLPASTASLDPGTLIRVGDMHRSVGGTVANTGLALHQLGIKTRMMGRISDDLFGDEVLRLLGNISPELSRDMIRVTGETTSYSVVIAPPGVDRLFLHCPGCNDHFQAADVKLPDDVNVRILHFGYPPVMRSIYQQDGEQLIKLFEKAHETGIATSLDMCSVDPTSEAGLLDWRQWLEHVLPHVDIFVPSLDELLYMLGENEQDISLEILQRISKQLIDWGVGVLMIKLGDYGVYLQTASELHTIFDAQAWANVSQYCPCFKVNVVSTNGAGDYTIAGFLAAILASQLPHHALRTAVGVGAAHVQSPDCLADWMEIQACISGRWETLDKTLN
jgi:sugar/nucleoside kinase (ribokinase family)